MDARQDGQPSTSGAAPSCAPAAAAAGQQQQQQRPQQQQGAPAPAPPAAASAAEDGPSTSSRGPDRQQLYLEQKYGDKAAHVNLTQAEVEGMLGQVLKESSTVKYLLESLKLGGCAVGKSFFHVTACDQRVGGGFSTDYGVILCHNRLQHYREVELAVAHELIHAYDYCRASNLDLTNCHHHACTEIRAANLSGDCSFGQELLRGNALSDSVVGQHKRCVRRRALMSVAMNPYCQGAKAERAVADMMPRCFKDTDPWPRVPGL